MAAVIIDRDLLFQTSSSDEDEGGGVAVENVVEILGAHVEQAANLVEAAPAVQQASVNWGEER